MTGNMPAKFISFDSWWGGLNNIRTTYELAGAISVVTGRTLIVPPKIYCLFLSEHHDKKSFFDFWELFDKNAFFENFNCIDYNDVPEYEKYNSEIQYYDGICDDIKCIPGLVHPNWGPASDSFLHDRISPIELRSDDKFIHFPRNLFGHWYYIVPVNNPKQRQEIKDKIKNGIKIKDKYETNFIKEPYNAIHVRSGDFNQVREKETSALFNNLREKVDQYIKPDKPLYIATDETDRERFACLNGYDCRYLSDFTQAENVAALAMDTLICRDAEEFYGTRLSTFSDYINILRYYENKKDCSKTLLNYKFTGQECYSWDNCFVNEY